MMKSIMSRLAGEKEDAKAGDKKGGKVVHNDGAHAQEGIKKSVSVNKHHDGHYSVAEHAGAEPVHHDDMDQAMEHVQGALDTEAGDEADADRESAQMGSRANQKQSVVSVGGKGSGIVRY